MPRTVTSVSIGNQAIAFVVWWGFGWMFIMHPPGVPGAYPAFVFIGCVSIGLSLVAVRNMGCLIMDIIRSLVGWR